MFRLHQKQTHYVICISCNVIIWSSAFIDVFTPRSIHCFYLLHMLSTFISDVRIDRWNSILDTAMRCGRAFFFEGWEIGSVDEYHLIICIHWCIHATIYTLFLFITYAVHFHVWRQNRQINSILHIMVEQEFRTCKAFKYCKTMSASIAMCSE